MMNKIMKKRNEITVNFLSFPLRTFQWFYIYQKWTVSWDGRTVGFSRERRCKAHKDKHYRGND